MIPLVFYSHSDYSDVWPALFYQTDRYFKRYKKYLLTNQDSQELENDWVVIRYDDTLPYQQRVVHCLRQIEEDIIIFHHEDMFLYDFPNEHKLKELITLVQNEESDIIKLSRASYGEKHNLVRSTTHSDVYDNPRDLKYAIQPSICRKSKLEKIYDKTHGDTIWEFETNSSMICNYFNIKTGMIWVQGDEKRGSFHWDSSIYPYFATAVVKGKWMISEYGDMLTSVLEEVGIDINERGFR
jgi:hypothetical protein